MKTSKASENSAPNNRSRAISERRRINTTEYANVNSCKHFLAVPSANHPYIKWAVGLRAYDPPKTLAVSSSAPPETYYKSI